VRRVDAATIEAVAGALARETPLAIWVNEAKVVELRLAVAGDALAVHARVADGQCAGAQEKWTGGSLDLYIANPTNVARVMHNADGPIVRQVVFLAVKPKDGAQAQVKQYTMNEKNEVIEWKSPDEFQFRIVPTEPFGYEAQALIPLAQLALNKDAREFLFEWAVNASAAPGARPMFARMFATKGDAGAFRDASLSAGVKVESN